MKRANRGFALKVPAWLSVNAGDDFIWSKNDLVGNALPVLKKGLDRFGLAH